MAPKWQRCSEGILVRTRSQPPSGFQKPSGPYLDLFWKRFDNILEPVVDLFRNLLLLRKHVGRMFNENNSCISVFPVLLLVENVSASIVSGSAEWRKPFNICI